MQLPVWNEWMNEWMTERASEWANSVCMSVRVRAKAFCVLFLFVFCGPSPAQWRMGLRHFIFWTRSSGERSSFRSAILVRVSSAIIYTTVEKKKKKKNVASFHPSLCIYLWPFIISCWRLTLCHFYVDISPFTSDHVSIFRLSPPNLFVSTSDLFTATFDLSSPCIGRDPFCVTSLHRRRSLDLRPASKLDHHIDFRPSSSLSRIFLPCFARPVASGPILPKPVEGPVDGALSIKMKTSRAIGRHRYTILLVLPFHLYVPFLFLWTSVGIYTDQKNRGPRGRNCWRVLVCSFFPSFIFLTRDSGARTVEWVLSGLAAATATGTYVWHFRIWPLT